MSATLLVTIGTDFHRFDRIIDWVDAWLARHPETVASTLVQHGASRPSTLARNVEFLAYDDLLAQMRRADVVITHGGPASLFEARALGRLPVCVPRDPALEEIVDDHQQRFARFLAEQQMVTLCEEQGRFEAVLDRAVVDPSSCAAVVDPERLVPAIVNVAGIVEEITGVGGRHRAGAQRSLTSAAQSR